MDGSLLPLQPYSLLRHFQQQQNMFAAELEWRQFLAAKFCVIYSWHTFSAQ